MKQKFIFLAIIAAFITAGFTSCSDDDLGASIFDTTEYPLDKTEYTFPLDSFVKVNFQEPYNLRFLYKMEDIGSDVQKNLVPCSYEKSEQLAVLCKYLWYDVYKKLAGENFVKEYSPRIIHVIGSPSYNPSTGTETLGTAEGGLKITLYNGNKIDPANLDYMNEYFFKTMHHEFGHILAQNKAYPTDFNLISTGSYNAVDWGETPDSVALGQGFVSPYASSAAREDWVEVIANYIVKDEKTWTNMMNTAHYDWETKEGYDAAAFDNAVYAGADRDTLGYFVGVSAYNENSGAASQYKIMRKVIRRDADDHAVLDENGKPIFVNNDGQDGQEVILRKLEMARTWLKENFNVDLDAIRDEVQHRQFLTDEKGNFVYDADGNYINHLTAPLDSDPSRTFMDTLLDEVNQYKKLQQ